MINDIINGIAVKLNQAFGSDYTIYKENVKQGLKEPCFFILPLEPTQEAKLPNRYLRTYPLDIHYFPKNGKSEMYEVAEILFLELEYVNVLANLIRGTKMRYELVDNVLHFFITYEFFIKKEMDAVDHMETLAIKSNPEE